MMPVWKVLLSPFASGSHVATLNNAFDITIIPKMCFLDSLLIPGFLKILLIIGLNAALACPHLCFISSVRLSAKSVPKCLYEKEIRSSIVPLFCFEGKSAVVLVMDYWPLHRC